MAIKKTDLYAGQVFQYHAGAKYAYKVVDWSTYIVGVKEAKFWTFRSGKIIDNRFMPGNDNSDFNLMAEEDALSAFECVWKPELTFKEGDILISDSGVMFAVGSSAYGGEVKKIWRLGKNPSWTTMGPTISVHGNLRRLTTADGMKFTGVKIG